MGDEQKVAVDNRDEVTRRITSAHIVEAQRLAVVVRQAIQGLLSKGYRSLYRNARGTLAVDTPTLFTSIHSSRTASMSPPSRRSCLCPLFTISRKGDSLDNQG
jgi:hypothetical protein